MEIPVRRVRVPRQEWAKLNQDVWSDEFVDAYLVEGDILIPIQLRYRGGHTREHSKKSFELRQDSRSIHLNAENDDPSMIRNALSFRFFDWIGVPSPLATYCMLIINGDMYGMYLEIEGVDTTFFQRRNLTCSTLMYAVNDDADFSLLDPETKSLKKSLFNGYEMVHGELASRRKFEKFIFNMNTLQGTSLAQYLRSRVDIQNYFKWMSGAVCTSNYDGFTQNYAVFQTVPDARYQLIPWDYEGTWGRNCFGKRFSSQSVRVNGYNILTKKLLAFPGFRKEYKDTLQNVLDSTFHIDRLRPEIETLLSTIREHMSIDQTRKWTQATVEKDRNVILNYINSRRQFLYKSLKNL